MMKKWGYFLSIIMFIMIGSTAFTQKDSENQNEWSEWKQTKCLKGIDYRVKMGKYEMSRRARKWELQFKNRYNATIHFNYKAISTAQIKDFNRARTSRNRIHLDGNSGETKVFSTFLKANKDIVVDIVKIRFGQKDIGKNYYKCDQKK